MTEPTTQAAHSGTCPSDCSALPVLEIGSQMATQVTAAIIGPHPLDREIMRRWANRYHDAYREWKKQNELLSKTDT